MILKARMAWLDENEVNNISECNLLNGILKPPKCTNFQNSHYSPILHLCMNIRKGKTKFNKFLNLFYNVCSSTIAMKMLAGKLHDKKRCCDAVAHASW